MPEYTPPGSSGTIDGTLTSNRIPFASDSDTLTDDADFTYDATNDLLTVTKTLTQVVVDVHNATASAIGAGTPVYVTGFVTANKPNVEPSDADSAGTMPSAGIVTNQIGAGSSGYMAISGVINGLSTSVITDGSPSAGAILYVSPTAGKLTVTKPTGTTSQIQNVGRIISINGGNFKMTVNNIGRTNDVPNEFTVPGDIEAASFTVTGGAGTDFLKGNGTLDSNTYVTAAGAITAVEGESTLDLTGAVTAPSIKSLRLPTVSSVTGALSSASHAGRYLFCSGNVTLPATPTAGEHYTILNTTGGDITISPDSLDTINGGSAGASVTVGTYNGATCIAISASAWIVLGV
jgi:hypothetical protein